MATDEDGMEPLCTCGHTLEDHGGSDQDPCDDDECECQEYDPDE